ncbi:MAG TPA: ubiquinol-cytochrome c reductase iron-sulfur subunit [Nitrospirota bacterium]|nr:ubiquinol-cytochrome c reductase iron-sulfur subunit [Nitrospirota bacterium]
MPTSRRDFLKKSLYGLLALLGLGFLIPAVGVLSPAGDREKELVFYPLLAEDEVPRSGVRKAELQYSVAGKMRKSRVFVVSRSGDLSVLSATCSHLGCLVNYHKDKGEFICPCHGGRYDLQGRNIAGPPPAPLTRFPVENRGGVIYVGVKV